MLQAADEAMADGILQPRMVEHGRVDEAGKRGLCRADLLGFAPYLAPDWIVTLDVRLCGRKWLGHENLELVPTGVLLLSLARARAKGAWLKSRARPPST